MNMDHRNRKQKKQRSFILVHDRALDAAYQAFGFFGY